MKRDLLMGCFTRADRIFAHIVTVSLYWSTVAGAQEPLPAVPPGEDVIVAIRKDAPAPFNGQLFDTNTAIRWGLWLKQYKSLMGLEKERAEQVCKVRLDYDKTMMAIEQEKFDTVERDLKERLTRTDTELKKAEYKLTNPAWYETGTFYFALGVATAGTLVWVGTKVIH